MFPLRSVVRKVSDTAARMVETENDGRGGVERMVPPIPIVFCFHLARMFAYLRNTPKKRQLRRREVSESRENRRLEGLTGGKGAGSEREMQNTKLLSPFIYFVKSVRILSQNQEPSNITEVKFCALIRQNFTS